MRYFLIAAVVLIIDQWTKWLVMRHMFQGESIPMIENIFYLTSHRNAGAAFGILQDQRWFFIIITIAVVAGLIYYIWQMKNENQVLVYSLAIILGGAVGNFIDRLIMGEVVDFLDVKISIGTFYYDFPIFNVADSALVIGVSLLIIDVIRDGIQSKKTGK